MNRVNVKKDYDWGLKKEQQVMDHLGEELGENFTKLGKFDHCFCCFFAPLYNLNYPFSFFLATTYLGAPTVVGYSKAIAP